MNSITTTNGGFDPVVFESVIDTMAGGATLDVTGYTNTDNVIPAGTPVGPKSTSTGLAPIVTHSSGTLSGPVFGYVRSTIPLVAGGNNHVAVVIEGVMRSAAMPTTYSGNATAMTNLKAATPKVTIV